LAVELTRRAERHVIANAKVVTVLSDFMVGEVSELGCRPQRLDVLPGGVDTVRFCPGPASRPSWTAGRFPLLFCARRLAAGKGVLELVRSMPAILGAYPNALLAIAGSGGEADLVEREIEAHGVRRAVRLLGDLKGDDLVNWMRCVDLCVVPTQRPEPFGLATVEALACGTPVVATPAGASGELLEPLDPRLVLPGLRPEDIARGICQAIGDQELMSDVRARARASVHPRFSWNEVASRWAQIYRDFSTPD